MDLESTMLIEVAPTKKDEGRMLSPMSIPTLSVYVTECTFLGGRYSSTLEEKRELLGGHGRAIWHKRHGREKEAARVGREQRVAEGWGKRGEKSAETNFIWKCCNEMYYFVC